MCSLRAAGVILAAGASRRLGSPKQLAVIKGERLLDRAIRTSRDSALAPIIVVLGANAECIEAECDLGSTLVVKNMDWPSGAASSIRAGVLAAQNLDVDAALLMTCDMPFVAADHLRALVALAESAKGNVGSKADGWQGVPACFLRASFAALLSLEGDMGARGLLRNALMVPLANADDIDTIEDLAAANRS